MTPTKVLECIRDRDGLHSNAASYEAAFVQQLAKELLEVRANRAALISRVIVVEEAVKKLSDDMLLVGRQLEQADADAKMWKGNYEAAEQHVTVLRTQLADNEKRWEQTFEKRAAREHEMIGEAIDDFCDAVLGKLKELGVPETDNCDGDDDVETIFAGWIHDRILDALEKRVDEQDFELVIKHPNEKVRRLWIERDNAKDKLRICLRALDLLRRDSKSPDFVKVYCALIEDELAALDSPAGRAAAEGSADETGESKSGAGSASS